MVATVSFSQRLSRSLDDTLTSLCFESGQVLLSLLKGHQLVRQMLQKSEQATQVVKQTADFVCIAYTLDGVCIPPVIDTLVAFRSIEWK